MVNKTFLLGNLGKDPELREVNNAPMCRFPLATTEFWTDSSGERKERTEWHNIVVWGNQAKSCAQYLGKGDRVFVEGQIRSRQIQNENEEKPRYITEIRANDVRFVTRKNAGASAAAAAPKPTSNTQDDIPF